MCENCQTSLACHLLQINHSLSSPQQQNWQYKQLEIQLSSLDQCEFISVHQPRTVKRKTRICVKYLQLGLRNSPHQTCLSEEGWLSDGESQRWLPLPPCTRPRLRCCLTSVKYKKDDLDVKRTFFICFNSKASQHLCRIIT